MTQATKIGNRQAGKKLPVMPDAPWLAWPITDRAERAIRFIETYCTAPKGYGSGRPLKLAQYQRDWLRTVLADGVNSAGMSVGRGNGKSTFLAAVAIWATFDPDESGAPQVPIVATTMNQAHRATYGVALAMIAVEPELAERCFVYSAIGAMKVVVPFTGGEMFPISNSPDGLQGLDPSLAVCDEIGFMPIESWDSLLLASGKRPRSLVVGIGTPGFDRDNALWHLRARVLEGIELPGFRFVEYAASEGCAIGDESEWAAANPALAEGYMNPDALRTAVALSPEAHFRIFRLGQWVDGAESWLGPDGRKLWDALTDPFEFELGADTWVGIDVGLKRDSTAVVTIQRRPDGRLHAKVRLWVPTAADPVDATDVMHFLRQLDAAYVLKAVSYDPRFFDVPAKMLEDEGLPMIEVPQSVEYMTPAVGSTFEMIKRRELSHDGDPAFAMHILDAIPRFNERGFTLAKGKSKGRIDAAVALCLAADRVLRAPAEVSVPEPWAAFA
jgi:phage terminase large subunit-like protein